MKILKLPFAKRKCWFQFSVVLLIFSGAVTQLQAQMATLNHNNSSIDVTMSGVSAGASNWQIDGLNHLYYQWFFYRVGAVGGESPVDSIAAPVFSTPNTNRLDVTWNNGSLSASVRYTLTGNTPGSGAAGLSETITLQNTSQSTLDLHFFQYSDFDLGDQIVGQSVQFLTNGLGQYFKAVQTDGSRSLTETVTSAAVPIGHIEANVYPGTIASLLDGLPTTLNDNILAGSIGGQQDVTFAYQWDITMAPNSSYIISKILSVVPEPSSFALISLGILGFGLLRRRSQKA
jgi:PEP-CTERM motif